jgi:hypothetical protein
MSRKIVISLCAALAVFAFGTMTVEQASGATMKITGRSFKEGFLAIYGFPSAAVPKAEEPVGGGLGLNFGFGQNMLFKAGGGYNPSEPLSFTLKTSGLETKACDSWIGGTLMSNHTGKNAPLSFGIEFADFQCSKANTGALPQSYADTQDQKWISEICAPGAKECRPEPLHEVSGLEEATVKIEHVAFDLGPGIVVQGAVWGKWENGAAGKPPCIKLQNMPAAAPQDQNLMVSESNNAGVKVGEVASVVSGKACLFSANNDWVTQSEKTEPAIEIANE